MIVKDLIKQLETLDPESKIRIEAPNAPPWIAEFRLTPVSEEDE